MLKDVLDGNGSLPDTGNIHLHDGIEPLAGGAAIRRRVNEVCSALQEQKQQFNSELKQAQQLRLDLATAKAEGVKHASNSHKELVQFEAEQRVAKALHKEAQEALAQESLAMRQAEAARSALAVQQAEAGHDAEELGRAVAAAVAEFSHKRALRKNTTGVREARAA